MIYRSYQHIERIDRAEVDGILNGTVHLQPKIDGTNSVVWLEDGKVHAGSRNRELSAAKNADNAGFYQMIEKDERVLRYLQAHPTHYLYGEFLVRHTIGYYDADAWRKFYIFDVFDAEVERYLSYDVYAPLIKEYDLDYIPEVATLVNPTLEDIKNWVRDDSNRAKLKFLISEEGKEPEGVVIKNYDFVNRYGRTVWGKIVFEEFFAKKTEVRVKNHEVKETDLETWAANAYITEAVIKKELAKLKLENPGVEDDLKLLGKLLGKVWETFLEEDLVDFIRKKNVKKLDLVALKKASDAQVKSYIL